MPLIGASPWEDELFEHLNSHVDNERENLNAYQHAADESQSPAFRYLVSLILEDEDRHHRLFADLAETVRIEAELRPAKPKVPRLGPWGGDREEVLELTDRLLDVEHSDLKELKRLARELGEVKDTTLWHLLVELMQADTAKHIHILEFIKKHARRPAF